MDQQFSLKWNNYLNQITNAFDSLKNEEDLVDVTISCEGRKIKAHKMLLSACSPYFRDIFKENPCQHPVIVFRNFKFVDLEAIIDFMYKGEVDVKQEHFETFLTTAELLEVTGLTGQTNEDDSNASKIFGSETELPEKPSMSISSINQQDPLGSKPEASRASLSKKRKSNISHPGKDSLSEKKQKSTESETPIVPKIEQEEFIEDLTFEEGDTDDSHSTSTDLSHGPTRDSRLDIVDYGSSSSRNNQDLSQLPKGLVHVSEAGPSIELPPEIMQTQEMNAHVTKTEHSTEIEMMTKESKGSKTTLNPKEPESCVNEELIKIEVSKSSTQKLNYTPNILDGKPFRAKTLNLPKGLTVLVKETSPTHSASHQRIEENITLRSEKAKTPIQEELIINQEQFPDIVEDTTSVHLISEEPEMAEEAPQLSVECIGEVVQEEEQEELVEEKEPEFDYFGCEVCKTDCKPVDKLNIVLNHKCPICPCVCFCSHLLKEHMKVIHGWFNVTRRFNQY